MEDHGSVALARLLETMPEAVIATHAQHGDATAQVDPGRIRPLLRFLRDDGDCDFEMLSDLCGVDHLGQEPRFEVVYHLYSVNRNHRVRIKARLPGPDPEIESVVSVWPAADWMEREAWDLYGIRFLEHPDLKRILLYEEFQGHPLRKDYAKGKRQPLLGPGS